MDGAEVLHPAGAGKGSRVLVRKVAETINQLGGADEGRVIPRNISIVLEVSWCYLSGRSIRLPAAWVRCYLTNMKTKISSKGQLVLPAELRQQDGIEPGEEFDIERLSPGEYRLVRRRRANEGVVEWLLACPEKDYFVPIESESTDRL
jgi:AbrB family looped-hinge helix DNA binding protein